MRTQSVSVSPLSASWLLRSSTTITISITIIIIFIVAPCRDSRDGATGLAFQPLPPALAGGKGWNVTSAGWQVTLCDPIWHVSSSGGVATSVSEVLYPCYFTLLYFKSTTDAVSRQRLRSASRRQLIVPRHRRTNFGRRVFTVAGPTVWNSLPDYLRDPSLSEDTFRRLLKTYLFALY